MEQKKVRLPREVAEALEKLGKRYSKDFILWHSSREDYPDAERDVWKTIHEFVYIPDAIFTLADALRYGYVIDEPIWVEITTEQQEKIRRYYESISKDDEESEEFKRGEQLGFREALTLTGIKIHGVNE
jgi:hypothetical protein